MSATVTMSARALHADRRLTTEAVRPRRVALLALAMILMGLADLQLTLTYMRSAGMLELNPLARAMVDLGGAPQLIRFKLFSIAASAGLLYLMRRHSLAERCAWVSCAALLLLTAHWVHYNNNATAIGVASADLADHRWVAIRD